MGAYDDSEPKTKVFRLPGWGLGLWVLPCPVIGFILCVVLSVVYDFEGSTRTHCRVPNYLPSISAAIGDFTPQRYIWRILIGLHCAPRFMFAFMYYNYYRSFPTAERSATYRFLCYAGCCLHVLENLCLVILTYVSSRENYSVHEFSFISFVVFSEFYMLVTCILYKWAHMNRNVTRREAKSYKFKLAMFSANVLAIMFASYFFWRHNTYCESGVYTIFATCEYLVVCSNIAFHATAFLDFGRGALEYSLSSETELKTK